MRLNDINFKIAVLILIAITPSCNKIVDINPPSTQITDANVFSSDASAISALQGLYVKLISSGSYDYLPTILPSMSADELINHTPNVSFDNYDNNSISITDAFDETLWKYSYNIIYQANALLEDIQQSSALSSPVRAQIQGEALFMRAFMYFELINFYGQCPLETSTNVLVNASAANSSEQSVYSQILIDLNRAANFLNDTYPTANRARVNRSAANALLARVYLYQGKWDSAVSFANMVINDPTYSLNLDLSTVFNRGSAETIWQYSTPNGYNDIGEQIIPNGMFPNFSFTQDFIKSIEPGDLRQINWMKQISTSDSSYYYPYKYKNNTSNTNSPEDLIVLRLAEQFLIRAEGYAQEGNFSQSREDLNAIRNRAGLSSLTYSTQDSLLNAIYHERRIELFTEWGHRWFDLKRTQTVSRIIGALKGVAWSDSDSLYPVPANEISANPKLTQNPGY